MAALERKGLAENTLLIFTSDNGPETTAYERIREHQHYSMGSLRGLKRDTWEGGHRVPLLARWPGIVEPNTVCDELVCVSDLMATAADIVGAELPADAGEDSFSMLPALSRVAGGNEQREATHAVRESVIHHTCSGRFAIRRGDWVFIDAPSGDDNREPDWFRQERGCEPHDHPGELFDLRQDPAETRNVYADHPEVVQELKALLEQQKRDGRSAKRKSSQSRM
jgi:arylsulfatase A-like enzyme